MISNARKTINKETQEAIKRLLTSNVSLQSMSPSTPTIQLDHIFSQILQKKREEQLEASKLSNMSKSKCDLSIESSGSEQKRLCDIETIPVQRATVVECENSMIFGKENKTLLPDDSFLVLEQQCDVNDKKEGLLNINENETILFDIEPPSDLWNQTVNQTADTTDAEDDNLDKTQDENANINDNANEIDDETIEISPVKYIGLIRPSTIIEETSSQFESSSQNSSESVSKSSLHKTASTINESVNDEPKITSTLNKSESMEVRAMDLQPSNDERQKRRTFAFKRTNHTFFPDINLDPINECAVSDEEANTETPIKISQRDKLISTDVNNTEDENSFNNTLERVDFFLEKGKQIIEEETANAQRNHLHHSLLETPTFSSKRKLLLNEMASFEMLPLAKRGPLIDYITPNISKQKRTHKFFDK
ncbi:uncharacterized protein LOC116347733 [Contarinia nasturtii]|uniref:uncharacterized protein LOC116347733 n=1 Tax=Contarinia nasturtii TaxID=265458 RepID=UPI0012D426DC|nr:uncharacterized protein LOC116347733 [Contarinia nasturtii]